jgi:hypothetical protein
MTATLSGTEPAAGIRAEVAAAAAVVIDVGTNPMPDGGLVEHVDADSVTGRVAGLTPVPGGVGPVTIALLLRHTVASARGWKRAPSSPPLASSGGVRGARVRPRLRPPLPDHTARSTS